MDPTFDTGVVQRHPEGTDPGGTRPTGAGQHDRRGRVAGERDRCLLARHEPTVARVAGTGVVMAPASEPASGSVRAMAGTAVPVGDPG